MKKIFTTVLALAMAMSLTYCSSEEKKAETAAPAKEEVKAPAVPAKTPAPAKKK